MAARWGSGPVGQRLEMAKWKAGSIAVRGRGQGGAGVCAAVRRFGGLRADFGRPRVVVDWVVGVWSLTLALPLALLLPLLVLVLVVSGGGGSGGVGREAVAVLRTTGAS